MPSLHRRSRNWETMGARMRKTNTTLGNPSNQSSTVSKERIEGTWRVFALGKDLETFAESHE